MNRAIKKYKIYCIIVIVFAFMELWTFRNLIFKGNLFSSDADGLIAILINEHWYKTILGFEKWNNWPCMFPVDNSVALNDMYILHSLIYVPLRFLGIDKYLAMNIVVIILHIVGTFSMYVFLHFTLRFSNEASILGTVCFSFANYYQIKMVHAQFFSLSIVPILMISLYKYIVITDAGKKSFLWGGNAVLTEVLLFYTSPYMAEFVIICTAIYGIWIFVVYKNKKQLINRILKFLKAKGVEILILAVIGIVLMIPFLWLYLPRIGSQMRDFYEPLYYCVPWYYIFNLSSDNLIYGRIMESLGMNFAEWNIGYTPAVWIMLVILFITLFVMNRGNVQLKALFLSVLSTLIIIMKFKGHTFWYYIFRFFPGANGLRAVCRIVLITFPIIGILIAWLADYLINYGKKEKIIKVAALVISIIVLAENSQAHGVKSWWTHDYAVERESFMSIAPPDDCKSFFVVDSSVEPSDEYAAGFFYRGCVDAWLVASMNNIPTLNGFASYIPQEYGTVYDIYSTGYMNEVERWIDLNALEDVYEYDFFTQKWSRYK